ncbi:MAG: DUF2334 domain-containing protein, partial [Nitrosopumilus sp.]|nr:DUF2334 domain-containing protein [Nitrosopumilus sp.]
MFSLIPSTQGVSSINATEQPCNCVVFRMDDIQDYWINSGQTAVMDLFLSKNQSLSLGLIMNGIGNDPEILDKVKEGFHKGYFELSLHGWDHTDHTKLNKEEQKESLNKANEKLNSIYGIKSDIFIPPENVFNNDTLEVINQSGIDVLSSSVYVEDKFDAGKSIFNIKNNTKIQGNKMINQQQIYHVPETIPYKGYDNNAGEWIKNSIRDIVNNVTVSIDKYGYAVIVLHPQDFVNIENGTSVNIVNENEIKDLSGLIDSLITNNIT